MENEFPIFVARWPICGLQLVRTTNIEKGLEFAKVQSQVQANPDSRNPIFSAEKKMSYVLR